MQHPSNRLQYFNPRSPHGERRAGVFSNAFRVRFQSTLPARGATICAGPGVRNKEFQSTLPARGATPSATRAFGTSRFQSTLPARGATFKGALAGIGSGISIHAPRTGSDGRLGGSPHRGVDFNPRSPHGERQVKARAVNQSKDISIHAPRTGSDAITICGWEFTGDFNPRSPHGERLTWGAKKYASEDNFNPRSPHGERQTGSSRSREAAKFQSTLPARGATARSRQKEGKKIFQSTLPARGATIRGNFQKLARLISIHAPRTGSDERIYQHLTFTHGFQSTLPARGATSSTFADLLGSAHFNPRSPHGERPKRCWKDCCSPANFNPRSPHGERHHQ